jgi:hypothetical protein
LIHRAPFTYENKIPASQDTSVTYSAPNLAANTATNRGNRDGSSEALEQLDYEEIRPLTLFGASIAKRASETGNSAWVDRIGDY